ncbi:TolB family protein [Bacterioplanoides pacificum]|uniref:TolB family protein n=1 Tax=Bacterioplanoides pacificum TaxID=1171596 RepID=A0ABV7VX72_9GAMM
MKRFLMGFALAAAVLNAYAFQSAIDDGGYYYLDSDEAGFDYDFEDISGDVSSTRVPLGGDDSEEITIGFPFEFYGTTYNKFYLSSKTVISFTKDNYNYNPESIPSPSAFNKLGSSVLGWWGDLNPNLTGGEVHYQIKGSAPDRRLIVQFTNTQVWGGGGNITLQFKLFESTNIIEVHYKRIYGESGEPYVVGIMKDATVGLQQFFGTGNSVQDSPPAFNTPFAIRYQRTAVGYKYQGGEPVELVEPGTQRIMDIDLTSLINNEVNLSFSYQGSAGVSVSGPASMQLAAGGTQALALELSALTSAEGFYDIQVLVSSDDPRVKSFVIPVRLHTYQLEQITPATNQAARRVSLSSDGQYAALISNSDLAGTGKTGSIFDVFRYNTEDDSYQQLTVNPVSRRCDLAVISGNGNVTAMICNSNLVPAEPNFGTFEVYIHDAEEGLISRIPATVNAYSVQGMLDISYDGTKVAFVSSFNPVGKNSDGSREVFLYDLNAKEMHQLTRLDNNNIGNIDLDYNGERFVVVSKGNTFGQNPLSRWQVFSGTLKNGLERQITLDNNDHSWMAAIAADGETITFASMAQLAGANNRYNIFTATFRGDDIKQVTRSASYDSSWPKLSSDGSRVAFLSEGSFDSRGLVNNAANFEPYIHDLQRNRTYMLADINSGADAVELAIADDSNSLLFRGNGDWQFGNNLAGNSQVFRIWGMGDNKVEGYSEEKAGLPVITLPGDKDHKRITKKYEDGGALWWLLMAISLAAVTGRRRFKQ